VTPVDVLELFLSTNMKNLSDTGISLFVDKNNFSTSAGVTEVFHICRLVCNSRTNTGTGVILIYKHEKPQ
jgi:hypothetical protein